jgi:RimJ/RimL family protein N-acetyltransferase
MVKVIELETSRLKLRQWRREDRPLFAKLNADSTVMEFFPSILDEKESNEMVNKIQSLISKRGWGFWAVEKKDKGQFIGFTGLHVPTAKLPFSPCVEIGWRLAKEFWGKGYATEAANAALNLAFEQLKISEVYSFASVGNLKSIALMERLQMVNTHKNFDHPSIPKGHSLKEHVLYKLPREQWKKSYNNTLQGTSE